MKDEMHSFEMAVFSVEPVSFGLRSHIQPDNILLHCWCAPWCTIWWELIAVVNQTLYELIVFVCWASSQRQFSLFHPFCKGWTVSSFEMWNIILCRTVCFHTYLPVATLGRRWYRNSKINSRLVPGHSDCVCVCLHSEPVLQPWWQAADLQR